MKIFTIGYQGWRSHELVVELKTHNVEMLIDVRSRPYSKKAEFNKPFISKTMEEAGISYRWAGRWLGGMQGDLTYDQIRELEKYQEALGRLVERIKTGQVICIMCMERNPFQCHRLGLIGVDLEKRDVQVIHLGYNGRKPEKKVEQKGLF